MEATYEGWNEHQWSQPNPRHVEIESAKPLLQRHCIRCSRDFVMDPSSGSTYAVLVSAMSFYRLEDEVTERWIGELCHGKKIPSDDADRNRKIAELTVSGTPGGY
jgi:hypothetical protein